MTVWYVGWNEFHPAYQTDAVISPDDGHIVARNM